MPQVVISAGDPADLLALVAVRLGFHPRESLVVACLEPPRGRLGLVLRSDLPGVELGAELVDTVLPVLVQNGAAEVVVAIVAQRVHAYAPMALGLLEALAEHRVRVREALLADGHRWWSLLCAHSHCCHAAGTPYDVGSSPALAQAVLAGVPVLPSRESLAARFAPGSGPRTQAVAVAAQAVQASLTRRWRRAGGGRALHRTPAVLGYGAARVRRLVTGAVGGSSPPVPSDLVTAELAVWATLLPVRDVAWSLMSRESAAAHANLWAHVARYAPPGTTAGPLALSGFACWLDGDGASAWLAVERCLQVSPGYSMAELLVQALERAVPPRAWTPIPEDVLDAALEPP